ncbi:hypothetical protein [uncultured Fibrobacter sp.]|uniref:hypothetical protein n=1 Tax=uncultured Fibrobacter sp. TaxID=261512 RepID=UPI0025DD8A84|nr:hypothetical protein [uncultured Fibrobacter sp.]
MAGIMESIGSFAANPLGLGDAGFGFLDQLGEQLGLSNKKQVQAGMESLDNLLAEANNISNQNKSLYGDYLGKMQGLYGEGAGQYADAVNRLTQAIGEGPESFTYGGNVNDFYDKFANQRQQAAMNSMRNMGGQNLFSSDFMNNMAAKQGALASEAWEKAYDKMMQDRHQQLAEWQAGQQAKQGYVNNLGTVAGLYGNDRNQLANAMGDYYSNMASQNNADLQARSDLTQAKTNLAMQENSGAGAILGGAGKVLGAIFGA